MSTMCTIYGLIILGIAYGLCYIFTRFGFSPNLYVLSYSLIIVFPSAMIVIWVSNLIDKRGENKDKKGR